MALELSVVLCGHEARASLERALEALALHTGRERTEVIVAESSAGGGPPLSQRFPFVRHLHFEGARPLQELRAEGIAAARAPVIAVLDAFSRVGSGWEDALLAAHQTQAAPAIGGAVEYGGPASVGRWAMYLYEYGGFMPPVAEGAVTLLPGCNVSYKRAALFDGERPREREFWKTFVHERLLASGQTLWLCPEAVVELDKPVPLGDFLLSRLAHGRCFAGMRSKGWSLGRRLLYAAGSPLLPLVFSARQVRGFWKKGRRRGWFVGTVPLQVLLFGLWSAGEASGYLLGAGHSGRSLSY